MGQTYKNLEVIVVDNCSTDRTGLIAHRYGARVYVRGPERGAQVNFGVRKARGKYVYRVDGDFILQSGVISEAVESCEKSGYDAVVIHNTSDPTISFWARVRKMERDCYKNDESNVAARFWNRRVFSILFGFEETLVAGDDYDFHNKLVESGFRIGRIEAHEVHLGEPKNIAEVFQKHYYYGKSISRFVRRNPRRAVVQLSPFRRAFVRGVPNLLGDPTVALGFVIYQSVRYVAATIGMTVARLDELLKSLIKANVS